jgi:hypothetical protein
VPEIRLLAESYREVAEMALERAFDALGCWYDPKPLFGAFDRLKSNDVALAPTALEYLGHILPRGIFEPVGHVFEPATTEPAATGSASDALADWIRSAWTSEDAWLRACAVRAARHVPSFDLALFATAADADAIVRAEVAALSIPARAATQAAPC